MELPAKKWTFRLGDMPEVFVSGKSMSSAVSKAVKDGRLRKIGSRLYTKNKMEAPDVLVKRNWHALLKEYFPDALLADRTALENRPAPDGSVFIISSGTRPVELPGVTFRPRQGHPALPSDLPFLGGVHVWSTTIISFHWRQLLFASSSGLSSSSCHLFSSVILGGEAPAVERSL